MAYYYDMDTVNNEPIIEAETKQLHKRVQMVSILSLTGCVVGLCVAQPYIPINVFVVGISMFISLLMWAVYLGRRG